MSKNNRRFTRAKFQAAVGYREKDGHFLEGSAAKDISEKGLKIKVEKFFPVETVLELQFNLPAFSRPLIVQGKVIWVRQTPHSERWEVGINLRTDKNSVAMIQRHISSNSP